ncbi:hypothetical protein MASR2M36_07760 [Providencia sp.]
MDIKLRDSKLDSIVERMDSEYKKIKILFEKTKASKGKAVEKIKEVSIGLVDNKYKKAIDKKLDKILDSMNYESSKAMKEIKKLGKDLAYNKENADDVRFKLDYEGLPFKLLEFSQSPLESNLKNLSADKYKFRNIDFDNIQGLRGRIFNSIAQYNRDNHNLTNAINRFLKLSHEAEMHITQLKIDAIQSLKDAEIFKPELLTPAHTEFLLPDLSHFSANNKPEVLDRHSYSTEMLINQISALPCQGSLSSELSMGNAQFRPNCKIYISGDLVTSC